MRCSLALLLFVVIVSLAACPAGAENYAELGYSEDTIITGDQSDQCVGTLIYNHDYSFENGYCWSSGGIVPPYYGAFAEGFDLGQSGTVECGMFWLSQIGYYFGNPMDAYVWEGGVHGPPGPVLCMVAGVTDLNLPYWPSCGLTEVEFNCCVTGDFTLGYWADFSHEACGFYICVDQNGPGGFPWTCIAPGIGYPTGWQDPTIVWGTTQSMGLGATITDDPSPTESQTWGAIKSLF